MLNSKQKSIGREFAFQFFYHLQLPEFKNFNEIEVLSKVDDFEKTYNEPDSESNALPLSELGKKFSIELICGVMKEQLELKEKIKPFLQKWSLDRLDRIDLTILLLGAFELIKMPETSKKVVINEAIELGKKFGTQDSSSFINAILDKVSKS